MRRAARQGLGTVACALALLASVGCASLHHRKTAGQPKCHEPPVSATVRNMPPLRVPPGLDAPDTRNAIKIPPLPEPLVAGAPSVTCLSEPPSFGGQLAPYTGPIHTRDVSSLSWHVNAGAALTMGHTSTFLKSGWTVGGGATYRRKPQSPFALNLDLGYANFNASHTLINLGQQQFHYGIDGGHGNVWSLTAAGKYTVPLTRNVNGYGLLGIGGYHESLNLTETALYGGIICDPWGYCYVVSAPGDIVVVSKSLTKFGWNVGLGLEIPVRNRSAWFFEVRYHRIQGSKTIQYLPLQVGYRF